MTKVKAHLCVEQLIISEFVVCGNSDHTQPVLLYDMNRHKQTQWFRMVMTTQRGKLQVKFMNYDLVQSKTITLVNSAGLPYLEETLKTWILQIMSRTLKYPWIS